MSNERDAAVERVLNDLRVLLTRRAETGCPCGRAERYTVPQGEVLAKLVEARTFAELALSTADRALEAIEAVTDAASTRPIMTRPQ